MSDRTPEERKEELRRLKERGQAARENMQAILDRVAARRVAEEARRARRRQFLRRLLPFDLSA